MASTSCAHHLRTVQGQASQVIEWAIRVYRPLKYEVNEGQPSCVKLSLRGRICEGNSLERLPTLNAPPSSPIHFPYQIKNSPFRDKIIPRQDVDLHGVAEVGGEELTVRKRNETH